MLWHVNVHIVLLSFVLFDYNYWCIPRSGVGFIYLFYTYCISVNYLGTYLSALLLLYPVRDLFSNMYGLCVMKVECSWNCFFVHKTYYFNRALIFVFVIILSILLPSDITHV